MSLFLATPVGRKPEWEYLSGCVETVRAYPETILATWRSGSIQFNRDVLSERFRASGYDRCLFVDTDVGFSHRHVKMLLETDKDVVGGLYSLKSETSPYYAGAIRSVDDGPVVPCDIVAAGFLMITREAILKVSASIPEQHYQVGGIGLVAALWQDIVDWSPGAKCYRDDAAFSKRCLDAGLELWVHTGCVLNHWGDNPFRPKPVK